LGKLIALVAILIFGDEAEEAVRFFRDLRRALQIEE
jgi:hypothetical protein